MTQETNFDELSWDELMEWETVRSQPLELSDQEVKDFNYRTILYKMDQDKYKLELLSDNVSFLSELLNDMVADGYLEVGSSEYKITKKGKDDLQNMADQYYSLVEHYDIYAHVDLDNACFLEEGDDASEKVMINGEEYDRYIDLRVPIMRFKHISPFPMVFLNLLREGRIASKSDWEFDMALGKELYKEVEEIVNSAYTLKDLTDLGHTNDNGEIPGSDILKDVIVFGNDTNKERKQAQVEAQKAAEKEATQQAQQEDYYEEEVVEETTYSYQRQPRFFTSYSYNSYDYYDNYHDPFYVEPCWNRYNRHHW